MRILFVSDFHGRVPDLSRWEADLVVAGGDYCEVDEIRKLKFEALSQGRAVKDWPQLAGPARAEALVRRALDEGSAVVRRIAADGRPVFAIPGNSDRVALEWPVLAERVRPRPDVPELGSVKDIDLHVVMFGGVA